jgi:glycosyltransferase involved in cell wall biosynthesis
MKVLHLIGGPLHSGAGRGARALHEGLMSAGVESRILGRLERDLPADLQALATPRWRGLFSGVRNRALRCWLEWRYGGLNMHFFPVGFGLGLHRFPDYGDADVLHVQWANGKTFSNGCWKALRDETRPVVWTLRDMWLFTGGCHFSGGCRRYETGCGRCPMLDGAERERVTVRDAAFKRGHLPATIAFVAPSEHTAEQARRSYVLQGRDVRVIPNSVALNRFPPIPARSARAALGLPHDKIILSAGAMSLAEPRKGRDVLSALLERYRNDERVHVALFGEGGGELASPLPGNCTDFGFIDDDRILNRIYAAADVFLMPSSEETFGKVTIEAMASGAPVIAFAGTPAEEMIRHGETGWLVPHGDCDAFAAAVKLATALGRESLAAMGRRASSETFVRFSIDGGIRAHVELYEELCASV